MDLNFFSVGGGEAEPLLLLHLHIDVGEPWGGGITMAIIIFY